MENIIEPFWKRWCFEYVILLREYQKGLKPKNQLFPVKNDLALLYQEKQAAQTKMAAPYTKSRWTSTWCKAITWKVQEQCR